MALLNISGMTLEVVAVKINDSSHAASPARRPLVFLHEGLGSVAMWRDWPATVCAATGRNGWVYSRRGYGQSAPQRSKLPADYLHQEAWQHLPALLDQIGAQKPVLLGHSDGGSIALLHACRFACTACIVMAPHVMVEDVSIDSIAKARSSFLDTKTGLRQKLAAYHTDVDGAFWQWNDVWLSDEFRSFDIRTDCHRITAPVLAIQGRQDPYGTLAQIDQIDLPALTHRAARSALDKTDGNSPAGIRRVVLENCGHSPHRDQPAATLGAIVEFLAQLP